MTRKHRSMGYSLAAGLACAIATGNPIAIALVVPLGLLLMHVLGPSDATMAARDARWMTAERREGRAQGYSDREIDAILDREYDRWT